VLVTGGAGAIGSAIVGRLLADPSFEVRVSDQRETPQWMREGCEVHTGDLRVPGQARAATRGCSHVIHLAAAAGGLANPCRLPHTLTEVANALHNSVIRAALDLDVERFVYVSSSMVFERAELFPTAEDYLPLCPLPLSAYGFSMLTGEVYCRAAHDEHDLPYTICRPFDAYGPGEIPDAEPDADLDAEPDAEPDADLDAEPDAEPVAEPDAEPAAEPDAKPDVEPGVVADSVADVIAMALAEHRPLRIAGSGEQTRTPTHVEDLAEGIVAAMSSPAGLNEDFNISASRELTVTEIARIAWQACGADPAAFAPEHLPAPTVEVQRRWPSVEKARLLLDWQARIEVEDGIASTARWLGQRGAIGSRAA
jgi:nucleoside-diphosphate-sugar epimerase